MNNNPINILPKQYSYNSLATITSIDIEILKKLRIDAIPDHITQVNGNYIPAKSVLLNRIVENVAQRRKILRG